MQVITDTQMIYGMYDGSYYQSIAYVIMDAPDGYMVDQLYIKHGEVVPIPEKPEGATTFEVLTGQWQYPPNVVLADGTRVILGTLMTRPDIQQALAIAAQDSPAITMLLTLLTAFVLKDMTLLSETYTQLKGWLQSQKVVE